MLSNPRPKAPVVAAVGPQLADAWEPFWHIVHHQRRTIAITDIGSVNFKGKHQTLSVYNHVSLATVDLFAAIETAFWLTDLGVLDRLAIDDCCTRLRIVAQRLSYDPRAGGL